MTEFVRKEPMTWAFALTDLLTEFEEDRLGPRVFPP